MKIFEEIMAEIFSNFIKTLNPKIQETQWILSTRNIKKKITPRHIIIKLFKTSNKILKAQREDINYRGAKIGMIADFSAETMSARRQWSKYSAKIPQKQRQNNYLFRHSEP